MASHGDKICPHLHVCLQSGSDAVLRRMKRRWGVRHFLDRCRIVREQLDHPALTTDIIVGFPGETDEDFAATCRTARAAGFSKIHIFPFSPRKGTPAAEMPDRITAAVKSERVRQLAELERQLQDDYFRSLTGRRLRVLVESPSETRPAHVFGTSCRYATVELAGREQQRGELIDVIPTRYEGGRLLA
jgi:threonylcarbamoyladenosine tRNA methylthiotransferase MtaB